MMFTIPGSTPERDTRSRLILAARLTMAELGLERMSMRAIAEVAGVTPGAIYRHFPSRSGLIDAVVKDALRELELHLLQAISSLPVGSYDRVTELGRQYIKMALATPEYFKILFTPNAPVKQKIADLPGAAGFNLLVKCVGECMDHGVLRPGDPRGTSLMLWTRVHGIVSFFSTIDVTDEFSAYANRDGALLFFETTHDSVLKGIAGCRL